MDPKHNRNIVVNGDGFGIAWYDSDVESTEPCALKFITPAWSNGNLRDISATIRSSLMFGHVRAASDSAHHDELNPMIVSYENCHPFKYSCWTFMHNGAVPAFNRIKLFLLNMLPTELFLFIKGTTDSEHLFALFLHILGPNKRHKGYELSIEELISALETLISTICQLCKYANIAGSCSLNICITNGVHVIASRFRGNAYDIVSDEPPSLYYSAGVEYNSQGGYFYGEDECAVEQDETGDEVRNVYEGEMTGVETCLDSESQMQSLRDDSGCEPHGSPLQCSKRNEYYIGASVHDTPSSAVDSKLDENTPDISGIIISSAPLGREDTPKKHFKLIPSNCMLVCEGDYEDASSISSIHLKRILVNRENEALKTLSESYTQEWKAQMDSRDLYLGQSKGILLCTNVSSMKLQGVNSMECLVHLTRAKSDGGLGCSSECMSNHDMGPEWTDFHKGNRTLMLAASKDKMKRSQLLQSIGKEMGNPCPYLIPAPVGNSPVLLLQRKTRAKSNKTQINSDTDSGCTSMRNSTCTDSSGNTSSDSLKSYDTSTSVDSEPHASSQHNACGVVDPLSDCKQASPIKELLTFSDGYCDSVSKPKPNSRFPLVLMWNILCIFICLLYCWVV